MARRTVRPKTLQGAGYNAAKKVSGSLSKRERLERRGIKLEPERVIEKELDARLKNDIAYRRGRGFTETSKKLDFDFSEFEGKRLLEVGCGAGNFVLGARREGILAEGIDPFVPPNNKFLHKAHVDEFHSEHKFACVLSSYSLPLHSTNAYNARLAVWKMLDLVEPGGKLVIYPYTGAPVKDGKLKKGHFEQMQESQAEHGIDFRKGVQERRYIGPGYAKFTESMIRKLSSLGFEIRTIPEEFDGYHYTTLVITKPGEEQVRQLAKLFGLK